MMNGKIDLRSDTVTWPTPEMRLAMANAVVGDDVYGDDPTVLELEAYAAELLGKESALFVPSGTMGNQLALMAQAGRGDEVILSDRCHIVWHEAGAAAILAGVQLRCLPVFEGRIDLVKIESTIRKDPANIHSPRTAMICLEDADSDGVVLDPGYLSQVKALADKYQVAVHLDGARLFNAATALDLPASQLARYADTVQICLSKGLCSPVGSLLAGKSETIALARRKRKILGGGMRQAGILAAAGLISLKIMTGRLKEDHEAARWLAGQLADRSDWFELISQPMINMVFFRLKNYPIAEIDVSNLLADKNILINGADDGVFRLVTHYWIEQTDLDHLLRVIDEMGQSAS